MLKHFAALLVASLALFLGACMTTTVSIGSGQVALVQAGTVTRTALPTPGGIATATATLPVASTAGNALVLIAGSGDGSSPLINSMPTGFVRLFVATETTGSDYEVWYYPNNPGGIAAINFSVSSGGQIWRASLSEWANVAAVSAMEASGAASATSGTTLSLATTSNTVTAGDVAIAGWLQRMAVASAVTFTTPSGFTRLVDDSASVTTGHLDIEYQPGPPTGSLLWPILTSTGTTSTAAGAIVVLKPGSPATDQSAYLQNGGVSIMKNSAEFSLILGGRYLLESDTGSDVSGYQLEDGSGVLILDTYIPQLGDPVTFAGPAWTGRVVSVQRQNIVEANRNYRLATVSAINSAADPGGTAPGDFSDVAAGGYYQLEDGSGNYQLEDGSGNYLLEGTTFRYRNLQHRQSQNQDGTTTVYGSLETYETGFAAGMTFLLSNADLGLLNASYAITNVTTSFIAIGTPVYTIEFGDAYQTLQTAGGGVLTQQAGVAAIQPGVQAPAGTLGYAPVAAAQTGITAATDLTGLQVTVTVVAGRRLHVTGFVTLQQITTAAVHTLTIQEGASVLATTTENMAIGDSRTSVVAAVLTPTAGVHTYKLTLASSAASGQISAAPSYLLVEDIGT